MLAKVVFLCFWAIVNLSVFYLAYDGIPFQDSSIVYGNGVLKNIHVNTQEDLEALDPRAYAINYVYNTRKCDYEAKET